VAIKDASMMTLKSGFNAYSFSVSSPADAVEEAVNCTPVAVKSPEPITEPVVVVEAPQQKEAVASLPPIPVAPLAEATKSSGLPIVIGGGGVATQGSQAPEAFLVAEAGDNVPLSDALPKIVPSNYTFRFAQGASAGEKISWGAGQDWLETLVLALDDTDLQVAVNNNVVTVLPSIQSTSMRVAGAPLPTTRDAIIVKEPDLTKPPSPGMMEEASAVLDQLRLDEKDLKVIVGGQVAHDGDDVVAMPSKPDALAQHEKMKPILDEDKVEIDDRPTDKGQDVQVKNIEVYRAEAGEDMADVVARWAKQANIELDMNLQRDYKLARDITVQGDIDLAASQLMAQFKDIPSAPRVGGEGADLVLNNEEVIDNVAPIKETSPVEDRLGVVARWSAAKGTSLHAALVNWARQGQMQLIWDGDRDVQIPENLQSTTRLGNALEMLLSLYDGQTDQPKIQINHDPDTGLIAMIISIEKQ